MADSSCISMAYDYFIATLLRSICPPSASYQKSKLARLRWVYLLTNRRPVIGDRPIHWRRITVLDFKSYAVSEHNAHYAGSYSPEEYRWIAANAKSKAANIMTLLCSDRE